jgi:hypothetical protein
METLDFNFVSDPAHRFATLDADGNAPTIAIDRDLGLLRITPFGAEPSEFPLIQDGEPYGQAVFFRQTADGTLNLEVGAVDFLGQAEYLEDYPLNDPEILDVWGLNLADGGITILDIRNLGRGISTIFAMDLVPIVLSITGIYLRVATLKWFANSGLEPWYRQVSIGNP